MRLTTIAVLVTLSAGGAAWAWQYEDEITLDQVGPRPGGGGNWATGGKSEFGVSCIMCHVPPDGGFAQRISVTITSNPAFGTAPDGGKGYTPGAGYVIDVTMGNEHLGFKPDGGNTSHNMFAATFENQAGAYVGTLASDTGFAKGGNCPAVLTQAHFNAYDAGSTTVTFAGCNAISGRTRGANGHKSAWRFRWTAPAAGQGRVFMYWGVTDGDGDEKTIGDDTLEGITVLEQL